MRLLVAGGKIAPARELGLRLAVLLVIILIGHDTFYSDVNNYHLRAQMLSWDSLPYRDFVWEYPPFAVLPLFVGAVLEPRLLFFVVFAVSTLLLEYLCLVLLRRPRPDDAMEITKIWTMSVVPLGAIAWFRLDFIAVFFAILSLNAMLAGRRYVAPVALGFSAKLWPLVFGVAMVLQRRWRDAFLTSAVCIAVLAGWYAFSPDGFHTFLDFRRGSGFQIESIPGSLLLTSGRPDDFLFGAVVVSDKGFEWVQVLLQVLFIAVPLAAIAIGWKRKPDLVALLGALVLVMILCNRLLSPQFLTWVAPFVVLLWPKARRPGWIFAVAAWLTVLSIQLYKFYFNGNHFVQAIVITRNALLVWLMIELFVRAFRPSPAVESQPSSIS